jgi:hypothetical protein
MRIDKLVGSYVTHTSLETLFTRKKTLTISEAENCLKFSFSSGNGPTSTISLNCDLNSVMKTDSKKLGGWSDGLSWRGKYGTILDDNSYRILLTSVCKGFSIAMGGHIEFNNLTAIKIISINGGHEHQLFSASNFHEAPAPDVVKKQQNDKVFKKLFSHSIFPCLNSHHANPEFKEENDLQPPSYNDAVSSLKNDTARRFR